MEVWICFSFFCPAFFKLDMFCFEVVEQISRVISLSRNYCPTHSTECRCSSDGLNPNQVQIMDVARVFFTSFSVSLSAMATQEDEYDDALQPVAARGSKFRG